MQKNVRRGNRTRVCGIHFSLLTRVHHEKLETFLLCFSPILIPFLLFVCEILLHARSFFFAKVYFVAKNFIFIEIDTKTFQVEKDKREKSRMCSFNYFFHCPFQFIFTISCV